MKNKLGSGFYFGAGAAILAAVGIVGCAMMGLVSESLFLAAGIALFAISAALKHNLLIYSSYACYLIAGSWFLSDELFTIANEIIAIDASGLQTSFVLAAAGIILAILASLVGTVLPMKKS